jgi:DNA-directed RNA polymerase specialized sigma24 family protein
MLCDEKQTREALSRIVARVASNPTLREDLLQEAVIHLWLEETRTPNQTRSWYLQSCKFHLQHFLAAGRSVDALKRRRGDVTEEFQNSEVNGNGSLHEADNSLLGQISAREIVELVSKKLRPRARAVLSGLADGLGARDIARQLRISHPAVIKHRRAIAKLLLDLGIAPPTNGNGRSAAKLNGVNGTNGAHHHGANGDQTKV